MKFSIAWHKEILANRIAHYQDQIRLAKESLAQSDKELTECEHYAKQIEEAERRGMTEFDRERLLKSNKKKVES